MLELGAQAPDMQVQTHLGYAGPLAHFWQKGPLILFFYPKDHTPICTKEACLLQSELAAFDEFDASILGSSTDTLDSHRSFAETQHLSFPLIADKSAILARRYQAFRRLLRVSKRVTYVIGMDGKISGRVHHEFSIQPHLEMIRQTLHG